MVGAYLLATSRTRLRALVNLAGIPVLSDLVREQQDVHQGIGLWQAVVREVAANPNVANGGIIWWQIETRPELHLSLRNGFLDVFDQLPSRGREADFTLRQGC